MGLQIIIGLQHHLGSPVHENLYLLEGISKSDKTSIRKFNSKHVIGDDRSEQLSRPVRAQHTSEQ